MGVYLNKMSTGGTLRKRAGITSHIGLGISEQFLRGKKNKSGQPYDVKANSHFLNTVIVVAKKETSAAVAKEHVVIFLVRLETVLN